MSRTSTRTDAVSQGALESETEFGLHEWMAALPSASQAAKMATFDTKAERMHHLPGQPERAPPSLLAVMA